MTRLNGLGTSFGGGVTRLRFMRNQGKVGRGRAAATLVSLLMRSDNGLGRCACGVGPVGIVDRAVVELN